MQTNLQTAFWAFIIITCLGLALTWLIWELEIRKLKHEIEKYEELLWNVEEELSRLD